MKNMKVTDVTFEDWNEAFDFGREVSLNPNVDIQMFEYPATDEGEAGWTLVTIEHPEEDTVLIQNMARTRPILNVQTFNLFNLDNA